MFSETTGLRCLLGPRSSPHLNPTEHLWDVPDKHGSSIKAPHHNFKEARPHPHRDLYVYPQRFPPYWRFIRPHEANIQRERRLFFLKPLPRLNKSESARSDSLSFTCGHHPNQQHNSGKSQSCVRAPETTDLVLVFTANFQILLEFVGFVNRSCTSSCLYSYNLCCIFIHFSSVFSIFLYFCGNVTALLWFCVDRRLMCSFFLCVCMENFLLAKTFLSLCGRTLKISAANISVPDTAARLQGSAWKERAFFLLQISVCSASRRLIGHDLIVDLYQVISLKLNFDEVRCGRRSRTVSRETDMCLLAFAGFKNGNILAPLIFTVWMCASRGQISTWYDMNPAYLSPPCSLMFLLCTFFVPQSALEDEGVSECVLRTDAAFTHTPHSHY